jgi:hypothetical protein
VVAVVVGEAAAERAVLRSNARVGALLLLLLLLLLLRYLFFLMI